MHTPGNNPPQAEHREILSGWKDIANYLHRGVRTVQRYEQELKLPVRRPAAKSGGSVLATRNDLDAWVRAIERQNTLQSQKKGAIATTTEGPKLKMTMERMKYLCEQLKRTTAEFGDSREKLCNTVQLLCPAVTKMRIVRSDGWGWGDVARADAT